MRKSGPLRSIRLCAYTAVGAGSEVAGAMTTGDGVPGEVAEVAGPLDGFDDLRCHNTQTNKKVGTAMRTMRRTRIQFHSMGMLVSAARRLVRSSTEPAWFRGWRESAGIHR